MCRATTPFSLCQTFSVRLNISFIQAQSRTFVPSLQKNQKDNGRNAMRHTQYGFTAFFAPQSSLQKTQSYSAKDLCQANGDAERPWRCVRTHCLRKKKSMNCWKWHPVQGWYVWNRQELGLHVEKQFMQMMYGNNSIHATLAGERKWMLLIAKEWGGGRIGGWVHPMLPSRN